MKQHKMKKNVTIVSRYRHALPLILNSISNSNIDSLDNKDTSIDSINNNNTNIPKK